MKMSHAENISRLPALFIGSNKETEKITGEI